MAHSVEGGSASADVIVACSLSSHGVAMYSGNQEKLQVRVQIAYCMQMRQRRTSELDLISSPLHPASFLSHTLYLESVYAWTKGDFLLLASRCRKGKEGVIRKLGR